MEIRLKSKRLVELHTYLCTAVYYATAATGLATAVAAHGEKRTRTICSREAFTPLRIIFE